MNVSSQQREAYGDYLDSRYPVLVDLTQDSDGDGDEPVPDRKRGSIRPAPHEIVELSDSDHESESEPDGKSERKAKRKAGAKAKPAAKGGLQRKAGKHKGKRKPGKAIKGGRVTRFWNFTSFPSEANLLSAVQRDGPVDGGDAVPRPNELDAESKDWDALELWICERAATLGDPELVRYAVLGREQCPETGRWHLQGYLECAQTKARTLGGMKLLLEDDTLHCEQVTISRQGARDYCRKDGTFVEFGSWLEGGQGTRSDLNDVAEMVLEGWNETDIAREAGPQMIRYSKGIARMRQLIQKPRKRPEIKVSVLWGSSGTGKTRTAIEMAEAEGKPYFKHTCEKDWFDGYDGEEIVIIDDFNSEISYPLLLQMLDRHACTVPVKGARVAWQATKIYITSNRHPREWYPSEHYNKGQLKRRLHDIRKVVDKRVSEYADDDVAWNDMSDIEFEPESE